MPDPNGTAALMKCDDVSQLEQYLCSLSVQLNVECSEVVPVEFYAEQSKTKCRLDQEARFHYKQGSITTHLTLFYHTLFLYCYSCVLKPPFCL